MHTRHAAAVHLRCAAAENEEVHDGFGLPLSRNSVTKSAQGLDAFVAGPRAHALQEDVATVQWLTRGRTASLPSSCTSVEIHMRPVADVEEALRAYYNCRSDSAAVCLFEWDSCICASVCSVSKVCWRSVCVWWICSALSERSVTGLRQRYWVQAGLPGRSFSLRPPCRVPPQISAASVPSIAGRLPLVES